MDETTSTKPKIREIIFLFLFGFGSFAFAPYVYFDLVDFETNGGERTMNRLGYLIYQAMGKWGVVALILVLGLLMLFYGFRKLRQRNRA